MLGGIRNRETINAIERRRNTVMNSDRPGQMQTLGVRNEFVRGNRGRSTLDTKETKTRRSTILNNTNNGVNGGTPNTGYIEASSDDDLAIADDTQDMQMQNIYAVGSRQSLGRNRQSQL